MPAWLSGDSMAESVPLVFLWPLKCTLRAESAVNINPLSEQPSDKKWCALVHKYVRSPHLLSWVTPSACARLDLSVPQGVKLPIPAVVASLVRKPLFGCLPFPVSLPETTSVFWDHFINTPLVVKSLLQGLRLGELELREGPNWNNKWIPLVPYSISTCLQVT